MAVNIGPRIGIDGEQEYRNQINNIINQTKTLSAEMKALASSFDKGGESLKQNKEHHKLLSEQIDLQKTRISELKTMLDESTAKFGENDNKTLKWKQAVANATAELNKMQQELKGLPNPLQLVGQKVQEVGEKIKDAGSKVSDFGQKLAPLSAAASGALVGSAKAAIDFETALTGVKKTNDELVDSNGNVIISYDDLADSIKEMSTQTASTKSDIASVMEAAGQLGVGTEYLSDFTKTMIMLGDSTNLSADEAASAIAKFANVTQMSLSDSDKLGSVIVDLGNNFATTEQDIVNMATRLSGAGSQVGLTQAQIMGFATALSSVGIEAEMGGSAFSKAMIKMQVAAETGYEPMNHITEVTGYTLRELQEFKEFDSKTFKGIAGDLGMLPSELENTLTAAQNLNSFAEVSNMTTEDFIKLYRDDAPSALQAFISGLGDTESHGESTIQMLQDMGFTEVRLRDTLTRLASSGDLVTQAVNMGTEAWEKNTALTDEAEKKYATTEAKISQAKEKISNLAIEIGERLLPYIDKGLSLADRLLEAWDGLDQSQQDMIVKITAVVAAAAPAIVMGGKIISGIGSIVSVGGTLVSGIGAVVGVLGGPLTLAIAGAVAAGVLIYKNWDTIKEKAGELGSWISEKWTGIRDSIANSQLGQVASTVWGAVKKTATDNMTAIKRKYDEHGGGLKGTAAAAWESIKQSYTTGFSFINNLTGGKLTEIKDAFVNKFTEIKNDALNWGKDIISNITKGIRDKISDVKEAVGSVASTISGYLHFSEPDKGPLANFHTWMPDMMHGLSTGIRDNLMEVERAASEVATAIAQPMNSTSNSYNYGDVTVQVYGAEGQDVRELAEAVDEIITARYEQLRQAWA